MILIQRQQKNWVDFQVFVGKQFRYEQDLSCTSGQFGFGNNAGGNTQQGTATQIDKSIDNFVSVHNVMQTTISGPKLTN